MKLNLNALNSAIDNAFAEVIAKADTEFIAVIEDPNEFADIGLPNQDIVDSGRFRDAQVVDVQANKATWTWDPTSPENGYHYALALWFGFFAYGGTKYVPGRHWAFRALRRADIVQTMAAELQKQGIKAKVVRDDVGLLDS